MCLVSVIMPAYNCEHYVGSAIESVLGQTYQHFEFIIVDDGSSDSTPDMIQKYADRHPGRIRFVQHPVNMGVSAARNTAIQHSRSDLLMLVDADDIQHPRRLEMTLDAMSRTQADMVFHDCEYIDEHGRSLGRTKGYPAGMNADNALWYQLQRNHLWTSLVMLRKTPDVYFDRTLPNAEDFELFLRLIIKGYRLEIVHKAFTQYRIHQTNISNNGILSNQSVQRVMQRLDMQHIYQLLAKQHGDQEARQAIAAVYLWRDEPEQAAGILGQAPGTFEGIFLLAVAKYKMNHWKESLVLFEKAHSIQQNAATVNNIGVIKFLLQKDRIQAADCFRKALDLHSEYIDASRNLVQVEDAGNDEPKLKLTERPLREQTVHSKHYKV